MSEQSSAASSCYKISRHSFIQRLTHCGADRIVQYITHDSIIEVRNLGQLNWFKLNYSLSLLTVTVNEWRDCSHLLQEYSGESYTIPRSTNLA